MQTALAARSSYAGAAVRTPAPAGARCSRSAVVVHASAESTETRRNVLGAFVGAALALTAAPALAILPVDLIDDRKVKANGFDIIYEARDLELPQSTRDGFDQAREDVAAVRKRIKDAESILDNKVSTLISKQYWTQAREALRLQLGTLRFDINTLAAQRGKTDQKAAQALNKVFLKKADDVDFAIRKKDPVKAAEALTKTSSALDELIAFLG